MTMGQFIYYKYRYRSELIIFLKRNKRAKSKEGQIMLFFGIQVMPDLEYVDDYIITERNKDGWHVIS